MRRVKSRRQTTGGLTELSITNCKQEMATVHVSFDSDDEFDFFTADKVRQAKMRDLEKAFESDIAVFDISDEESCDDNSNEHSDSEDDIALADITGLLWSEILRPLPTSEFSGRTPDKNGWIKD